MARTVDNALDHDRKVGGRVEDEIMTMHCDPHARSVLLSAAM
jgi:hypothetical protein